MPSADDKRTAITLKVNLSCTLMAVALAFIGAAAGIATFVLDKRAHLLWFNVVFIGSIASLVFSGFCGGKGIATAYKSGFEEEWTREDGGSFNSQALALLLGIALVCLSAFLGVPKKPDTVTSDNVQCLEKRVAALEQRVDGMQLKANTSASIDHGQTQVPHKPKQKPAGAHRP